MHLILLQLDVEILLEGVSKLLSRQSLIVVLVVFVEQVSDVPLELVDLGGQRLDDVFDSDRESLLLNFRLEGVEELLLVDIAFAAQVEVTKDVHEFSVGNLLVQVLDQLVEIFAHHLVFRGI